MTIFGGNAPPFCVLLRGRTLHTSLRLLSYCLRIRQPAGRHFVLTYA